MKTWCLIGVVLCCSLCWAAGLFAQDGAPPGPEPGKPETTLTGRLFVHTSPMGAQVAVNGALQEGLTPLLLELPAGRYRLELTKQGYERLRVRVEVEAGKSAAVRQALAGNLVAASFPTEGEILLHGQAVPAGQAVFGLSPGSYRLESRGQTVSVMRQAPQDRWIDALHIVFPLFLGFAVYLTVDEALNPSGGASPFSPAVIATYAVTTALIGVDIGLNAAKRRFERSLSFETLSAPASAASPQGLYREVESLYAASRLEEALAACERLPAEAPESPYVPFALYRRAQILGLQGEPEAAVAALEALLEEYPVPDLYDRCLLGLAELRLEAGDYEAALGHVRSMPILDPELVKPDAISLAREILTRWAEVDPEAAEAATENLGQLSGAE